MAHPNTTRKMPTASDIGNRKFYNVAGWLTPYALACGYRETGESSIADVSLWQELGVYHVRANDKKTRKIIFWESFSSVGAARRRFAKGV